MKRDATSPGLVLLWGLLEDPTFRAVHDAVGALGGRAVLVSHAALDRTRVRLSVGEERDHVLSIDGQTLRLREVSAAYLRPHDRRHYELDPERMRRAALVHQLMSDWAEHSAGVIVNRPSAEATNHCKLLQAAAARACGLSTPNSIVSNDEQALLSFHASHGRTVIKSLSSVRSVVREFSPTQLDGRAEGIGPALLQEHIDGRAVRVHVVGEQTFACTVESRAVDYRYALSRITPTTLDEEVAGRCVELTKRLGLLVSGIDLIVTSEDEWHCLEANPNPGFSAFDPGQQEQIAHALALMLTSADPDTVMSRLLSRC